MINNKQIFLLTLCTIAGTAFAADFIDPREAIDAFRQAAEELQRDIQREADRKAREKAELIRTLEERLERAHREGNEGLAAHLRGELARESEQRRKTEERAERIVEGFTNVIQGGINTYQDMLKQHQKGEQDIKIAAVQAHQKGKADVERMKIIMQNLADPQTLKRWGAGLTLTAFGIFGSWQVTKLAGEMITHLYRNPTLAQETSLISPKERLYKFVMGIKPEVTKVSDVILEQNLAARIATLAESVTNTVKNNAFFRHILFYGPPGTGKTMLAQRIARTAGLDYIYFAASSLDQFSIEEAMIKLTELFEYAKRSTKKLMIIIDESEMLFANREKGLSEKARKMLTHILTYTGTEQKDYVIVALTNRPQDLDSAFISRCDERILIDAPAPEQRRQILDMYVKKFLINSTIVQKPTGSFIARMFSSGPKIKQLTIKPEVLDAAYLDAVNARLDGFVGRDISKLVIAVQSTAYTTKDAIVTKEMFDTILDQKIEQKKQETLGFKVTKQ